MTIQYRIGQAAEALGLSVDTLRYYEKRCLLPPVSRNSAGIRIYDDRDMSRLRFIRRAQKMNFSLDEIGQLLSMRENPQRARNEVRELTHRKLQAIDDSISDLTTLRDELSLLINLCQSAKDGCPILEGLDDDG